VSLIRKRKRESHKQNAGKDGRYNGTVGCRWDGEAKERAGWRTLRRVPGRVPRRVGRSVSPSRDEDLVATSEEDESVRRGDGRGVPRAVPLGLGPRGRGANTRHKGVRHRQISSRHHGYFASPFFTSTNTRARKPRKYKHLPHKHTAQR